MTRTVTTYQQKAKWIERDFSSLAGKTIKRVRPMTKDECEVFGWDFDSEDYAMVIIFTDGFCMVPSCDPEGNGAGFLFVEKLG